jgi:nucleoside-diphosphate-sugar epimerase
VVEGVVRMKVLITGSEGFVGRAFQRYFRNMGYDIVRVDLKKGDDAHVFFTINDSRYDLIIHLAALVGGRVQIEQGPFTLAARDLQLDASMLRWAVESRQRCPILYFSSSAAYPVHLQGRYEHVPLKEEHIDLQDIYSPDFSYGWVKLTGEQMAAWAMKEHGLDVRVFRPFSGYGADQDLDYPFPSFIDRALRKDSPFTVWGDGTQSRDFIHIDDVVKGAMTAVDSGYKKPLNLGTGVATSFNDLAALVMKASGHEAPLFHRRGSPTGVQHRVADITNLHRIYRPRVSLEEGIDRALKERALSA